jgi:hypothetical protein
MGLLFQASMLFIALIAFMLLQPYVSGETFTPQDILMVLVMALVCFIPFGLYLRGIISSTKLH